MRGVANYAYDGQYTLSECDPDMIEQAKKIEYAHFNNNCIGLADLAKKLEYGSGHILRNDDMVRYRKSKIGGKRCMYMVRQKVYFVWRERE